MPSKKSQRKKRVEIVNVSESQSPKPDVEIPEVRQPKNKRNKGADGSHSNNVDNVEPDDSVSQTGNYSSVSSTASSVTARRLRLVAEKASLEARLAATNELKQIEYEELLLKQRKEEMELRIQLKSMQVEESALKILAPESEMNLEDSNYIATSDAVISFKSNQVSQPRMVEVSSVVNADRLNVSINKVTPHINSATSNDHNVCDDTNMAQLILNSQRQQRELIDSIRLPTTQLPKFDGDPLKYWSFAKTFDNVMERGVIDNSQKLVRLVEACTDKARKVIECCLVMDANEGYKRARELLHERFGDNFMIANAWITRITKFKFIRDNERDKLQEFSDELKSCLETLSCMGYLEEANNQTVLLQVIERLPNYLQQRFKKEARQIRERQQRSPRFSDVVTFVRLAAAEANNPVYGGLASQPQRMTSLQTRETSASNRSHLTTSAAFSNNVQQHEDTASSRDSGVRPQAQQCIVCNEEHSLFGCQQFKDMNVNERIIIVKRHRLCFNCLQPHHTAESCNLNRTCSVHGCGRKHTKFLHKTSAPVNLPTNLQSTVYGQPNSVFPYVNPSNQSSATTNLTGVGSFTGVGDARTALPMLSVVIRNPSNGRSMKTLALLDPGSTNTFCTRRLVEKLSLRGHEENLNLSTLEKANSILKTLVVSFQVSDKDEMNAIVVRKAYVKETMPINVNNLATSADISSWHHLEFITLPDASGQVDLLIGQDVPEALVPKETRSSDEAGAPYAVRYRLGWTINGPLSATSPTVSTASVNFVQLDTDLSLQLERFWAVDSIPTKMDDNSLWSMNDKRVLDMWQKTTLYRNGHYEVLIPFKQDPACLPVNIELARNRLARLKTRLTRNAVLYEQYKTYMQGLIDKGHAELVHPSNDNTTGPIWYLPHHPVFNVNKPGKIRVVFDCSARHDGTSLNDNTLQGPDLNNKLLGVLIRFRQGQIAVSADIEAMFHQVKVTQEHRDALRYLWWPNGDMDKEPATFRMTVHLFGGTWSPSACSYALRRTAEDRRTTYSQEAVDTVLRNFYVDDCLKSTSTEPRAIELVTELRSLLGEGGFRLHKFMSNSQVVLRAIPEEERGRCTTDRLLFLNDNVPRVLGVRWNVTTDCIGISSDVNVKPLTRRGIMSTVASIFDPLGYASPFVLPAKRMLQELCRRNVGWDDELPQDLHEAWETWLKDLAKLDNFSMKRSLLPDGLLPEEARCELHIFCDASYKGYGAVCYVRISNDSGVISVNLLIAKTRLAPINQMTIPRLELSAAVMAVKLEAYVRQELDFKVDRSVFWTDSTVVLQYINNDSQRFQVFVANRVSIIRNSSAPSQWRHVSTKVNPADLVSRGLTANELIENRLWLEGPKFLQYNEENWPDKLVLSSCLTENDPELKRETAIYAVNVDEVKNATMLSQMFYKYSSFNKLKKAVACWLRMKSYLFAKIKGNALPNMKAPLTVVEVKIAETEILKCVQAEHFLDALNGVDAPKSNPLYQLEAFVDNGLLCVGGRSPTHQIILPKRHVVVELIVRECHETSAHMGQEYVLGILRQKYWILGARRIIKSVLRSCRKCRLKFARPLGQKMANLPKERLTPDKPPFTVTGVDFFGPILIKIGRSEVKRYGCLFTCFTTRALHLEVAESLETDAFLNAFQRFIARRGRPECLWSDNGTNFVGAANELKTAIKAWNTQKIEEYMRQREIDWHFNPPSASHMGGIWERMIRTVRKVLISVTNQQTLTDDALHTLLCITEDIVNSRPLTLVSSDVQDLNPLTPNHLLRLRADQQFPLGIFEPRDTYARRRWKQIQYLANLFWQRWLKEYLPILQLRSKWLRQQSSLVSGDVVLVVDDNLPRNHWQLGRVVETYAGTDGLVRSAKVVTRQNTYVRPVHKLCLIEGTGDDNIR